MMDRYKVSDNLEIVTYQWDGEFFTRIAGRPIKSTELPTFITTLEVVATEAGVETVRAELAAALKDLLWAMNGWGEGEPPAAIIASATEVLQRVGG